MQKPIEELSGRDHIIIKGARIHNLKGIDLVLKRNQMIVVTGLSGSGKSSLIFDTLFAEGQRKYVESLSSYARQFLTRMKKPEVDYIKGLSPAMAIEQKVTTNNPRSTVGTSTEIYDYLKLLFARVGKTISPVSDKEVTKNSVTDVVNYIAGLEVDAKIEVLTPLIAHADRSLEEDLAVLLQKGFTRINLRNKTIKIEDITQYENVTGDISSNEIKILIDRFVLKNISDEFLARVADSAQTAFYEGHGTCVLHVEYADGKTETIEFSDRFELDGILFEEPTVNLFSFNNPFGICKHCDGFGTVIGIDKKLVIPDKSLSVYEGAVSCWKGEKMGEYLQDFISKSIQFDFPIHRPVNELNEEQYNFLWHGNASVMGINDFFEYLETQSYKIQYRVLLSRYRGRTTCPDCRGTRIRKDAGYVYLQHATQSKRINIQEAVLTPIDELLAYFINFTLEPPLEKAGKRILLEITNRLRYLTQVGLGYLNLNRLSRTLSGGESQRIKLATSLGSSLVGSLYILDEPSIGLHPRDNEKLVAVLKHLRDLGNTVIVVEHEESVIHAADNIVDIGPQAGEHGGELVFQGSYSDLLKSNTSLTGMYLANKMSIALPAMRRPWGKMIELLGVSQHNIKNINLVIPLHVLTVVTGVSGSGKTTLIKNVLYPAIKRQLEGIGEDLGNYQSISGCEYLKSIELIDQNPIGKSSRSNPASYTGAYDAIRTLLSQQHLAVSRQLKPGYFSFNTEGGRCEVCKGDGVVTIEMQFLADVTLECESCFGKRFKDDALEIRYKDKNVADILDMTVDEAVAFFVNDKAIMGKLKPLQDVGLGYIRLGQSSSTLSGGEAQRVKLASFLTRGNNAQNALFIFDEPTTGLHFHDIKKLLGAINALIEQGNTVIVIEHNMDVIKTADWIIDLGPDAGIHGGEIVLAGKPEDLATNPISFTAQYLKEKL